MDKWNKILHAARCNARMILPWTIQTVWNHLGGPSCLFYHTLVSLPGLVFFGIFSQYCRVGLEKLGLGVGLGVGLGIGSGLGLALATAFAIHSVGLVGLLGWVSLVSSSKLCGV